MIVATVLGPIWATKRLDGLPSGALLEIRELDTGNRLVALDTLGSGAGDQVLVAQGSVVASHLPGHPPIDAMIVGLVDTNSKSK